MNANKTTILIEGPGRGHNIELVLNEFNKANSFDITLLTKKNYFSQSQFSNIKIEEYYNKNKILKWLLFVRKLRSIKKKDFYYIQDGDLIKLILTYLFGKYKKIIFNVWSENHVHIMNNNRILKYCYKYIFKRIYKVHFNWYGTYSSYTQIIPELKSNSVILPWGLENSFLEETSIKSSFVKDFIARIPSDKVVMINMRSISEYNCIELLLEAILQIKNSNRTHNLLLVFWCGNNEDIKIKNHIINFIQRNELTDTIWYVEHPFLPSSDIRHIINKTHIVVNLVKHDQLSLSLLESLYLKKENICSDIEAYRIFNERYKLQLELLPNDVDAVKNEILNLADKITCNKQEQGILEYRQEIVVKNFNMAMNFQKIFALFQSA